MNFKIGLPHFPSQNRIHCHLHGKITGTALKMKSKSLQKNQSECSFDADHQCSSLSCNENLQPRSRSPLSFVKETLKSAPTCNLLSPVNTYSVSRTESTITCEQRSFIGDYLTNKSVVFRHKNKRNLPIDNTVNDRILLRSSPINHESQDKHECLTLDPVDGLSNRSDCVLRYNSNEYKNETRPLFESNKLFPTFCGEDANKGVAFKKLYHITLSSSE